MPTTNINYIGTVPPKMYQAVAYREVPFLFGSGGSGPAVPVPVAVVLHDGTTGVSYSELITAQGGTSPYAFSVVSGALPTGCSMSSGGLITGTPSAAGTFGFTVEVVDALGSTGTQTFQIVISAPASSGGGAFTFLS